MSFESASLSDAIRTLEEISDRARALGIGLAKYPVADVERVIAVLAGKRAGVAAVRACEQNMGATDAK